jgi:hypothetical protein
VEGDTQYLLPGPTAEELSPVLSYKESKLTKPLVFPFRYAPRGGLAA